MGLRNCIAIFVSAGLALGTFSCGKTPSTVGSIYSCDSFTVYPDSLVSDSLIIAPRGSLGIAVIREGAPVFHPLHLPDPARLSLAGSDTLLIDLFNDYADRNAAVASGASDIALWGLPADPSAVAAFVDRGSADDRPECHWPVVSSWTDRCIALDQLYLATGDHRYFSERDRLLKKWVERDRRYLFDETIGLYRGTSSDPTACGIFPKDMNVADRASLCSFRSNIERLICLDILSSGPDGDRFKASRDSLANAIDTYFWIPDLNAYSVALYGYPSDIQAQVADNRSQAMAVGYGAVCDPIAEALVGNAPVFSGSVPGFYPSAAATPSDVALFCIAAARTANDKAFSTALAQLVYMTSNQRLSPLYLRGVLLRGLAGISYTSEGMRFTPFVPEALEGEKRFTNIPYREAVLDVTINGFGDVVSTFSIDGEVRSDCMVPAGLTGHHSVAITLVGSSGRPSKCNVVTPSLLPSAPEVQWHTPRSAQVSCHSAEACIVYLNGVPVEQITSGNYEIKQPAEVTAVNFVPVADSRTGIFLPTYLYIPPSDSVSVNVSDIARTGARSLKDKDLSRRFVESTRFKNAKIRFEYDAPDDGDYYVQISYFNGLGIVNPDRHYALRTLSLDDRYAGMFILPQLPPERWLPGVDWQTLRGLSLPVKVTLHRGINRLSLDYFDPGVSDFDHDANTLIPDKIILTRINDKQSYRKQP